MYYCVIVAFCQHVLNDHAMLCYILMLNFDRFTVKHGTQNIQNYCNQWLSDSFRVHQLHFRPGLRSVPHCGSLQRSPDSLAGLRVPTSKGRGGREPQRGKEEGNGRGR